jgi:hypothetical protein
MRFSGNVSLTQYDDVGGTTTIVKYYHITKPGGKSKVAPSSSQGPHLLVYKVAVDISPSSLIPEQACLGVLQKPPRTLRQTFHVRRTGLWQM